MRRRSPALRRIPEPGDPASHDASTPVSSETRDWTVVVHEPCGECGFDPHVLETADGPQWALEGRRGDGAVFTTRTLAAYLVHDLEHHLVDVG